MIEKPKISDIASQSGVSVSTVSLVLNNKPGVSQDTRQRVLEIADQLGYPSKAKPVNGIQANLTTVGMLVKTNPEEPPQANPFYSKVILGIEDVCRRNGINLLFATLPVDEDNCPIIVPQLIYNESVDGLLMVGTFVDETFTAFSARRTPPIVLVDGYSNSESYDAIT
jgi:LacI family transcriptional regulator